MTISAVETVTITFDAGGGSAVPPQFIEKGQKAVRPSSDPVRSGYTFVAWLHNLVPYEFTAPVNTDLTLTAQWKADSAYTYKVGDGSIWMKKSGLPLIFRITNTADDTKTKDNFKGVRVDGNGVDSSKYDVKSGSVIIELHPNYLETLSVGEHRLTAEFTDGTAEARFTVTENAVIPENLPQTGDTAKPLLYGFLALIALVGLGLLIKKK